MWILYLPRTRDRRRAVLRNSFGYDKDKVMMTGDAPGDLDAAEKNGVFYYPILVRHEAESWERIEEAAKHLTEGTYAR